MPQEEKKNKYIFSFWSQLKKMNIGPPPYKYKSIIMIKGYLLFICANIIFSVLHTFHCIFKDEILLPPIYRFGNCSLESLADEAHEGIRMKI